ncbi:MAG: DUF721 domain-containing protein [Actinobacteria bacterium]|nr:DUF721 domain-containing protein [Actinomycetota bacterium]
MNHDEGQDWVFSGDDAYPIRNHPRRLSDLVREAARGRRWLGRLEGAAVYSRWDELVGPELARRCEPVRLAGGVLTVRAETSVWATQVGYLAGEVARRAEEVLGPGLVGDVKVIVGPLQGLARRPDDSR